jgi:phenylpropionate dioxygenase-like ring-hydroxylating dioxygenase large terminal subunit
MSDRDPELAVGGGEARCPGVSWDDLVAADSRPVPEFMAKEVYEYRGSAPLATERYTGDAFFRAEIGKMWPHVWQMAARDEDMPEAGDVVVYENAGRSYLLCRQADGSVRAFHNVCLHRGRRIRSESGPATMLHCPYHGFAWNLDGTVKDIPCRWDFPHLDDDGMKLPEAEVDRWGGYIFLREEPGGPSLLDYLHPLPEHFARWPHEECTTSVHVAKVIHANWKAVMEAFMEAWHTSCTHPQIAPFVSDTNTRYNIYGDNVNVGFNPLGAMSPEIDPAGKSEQWVVEEFLKFNGRSALDDGQPPIAVPEGGTARRELGARAREDYGKLMQRDIDHATDAELLDSIFYSVFPNWGPWGGFMPSIDYRFRPWPDQHHTLMEVRILTRVPPGQPIPRAVPMTMLGDGETWASCPAIGEALGHVLDQDVFNVEEQQLGLRASKTGTVQLSDYQEIRIRQFHQTADTYLAR